MSGAHSAALTGVAGRVDGPVHRLDPRAKLIGLGGVTVVAVTTPAGAWPVLLACLAVLLAVAAAARVPAGTIWRRGRVVLPPVLLVAAVLPFVRHGGAAWGLGPLTVSGDGLRTAADVAAKAVLGTLSAVLLGATTPFPDVLRALERLRVPHAFTTIAAFMYRYLFVIADEVRRMRAALTSRGYRPRHALHAAAVGRLATALFLRTYARAERVYLAMASRGYRGRMPGDAALRLGAPDAVFLAALAVLLVPLRVMAVAA